MVKTYAQLREYLNKKLIGERIRGSRSAWSAFMDIENALREIDRNFCVKKSRYTRSNAHERGLYYKDVYLGLVEYKATSDGTFKSIKLSVALMDSVSWDEAISQDEEYKKQKELETTELLKERGFDNFDELIDYLRKFSASIKSDIRSKVY